jgi:type IV secretion system protein VirD4
MLMKPAAVICRLMLGASVLMAAAAFVAAGLHYPIIFYGGGAAFVWKRLRRGPGLWSHGTARVASWVSDLLGNGMLGDDDGLILGRVGFDAQPTVWQAVRFLFSPGIPSDLACQVVLSGVLRGRLAGRMIRINKYVHLMTCAPAGAGKSVSVLVPNLRSYRGSCVVIDPKGELWRLTRASRKKLGQRVVLLDPFGVCKAKSCGFNPLSSIDATAPDFLDKCRDLANMLVVRQGTEHEPFWNDMAELVLTAFIAYVCACEDRPHLRTLTTLRRLICSRTGFTRSIAYMQQTPGFGDVISRHGKLLQWLVDRELSGVMTTVQRHTAWMDSPLVAKSLSKTTFDPKWLRTRRCTVYFVLPHDKLTTLQPLMRTWIGCTLRIATQSGADERNPVLFLLDEAGHLGRMQALEDAVTLLRGYGIRLWFFFQSLVQIRKCYGEHASIILDNLQTQQYFGINSYETAEMIAKRIGEETIVLTTQNGGSSRSWPTGPSREPQPGNSSVNTGWSVTELGRQIFKPEEIMVLPEDLALIFHRSLPVIAARLLRYYDAPEFANSGTGSQRGVGLASLAVAACILVLAVLGLGVAGSLPSPQALRQSSIPAYGRGVPGLEDIRLDPAWPASRPGGWPSY